MRIRASVVRLLRLRPIRTTLPNARRLLDVSLIVLFIAALVIPTIWGLGVAPPAVPAAENRAPAPLPEWRHWSTSRFEKFFNDRIGFRRELLAFHAISKFGWFGRPSTPSVAIGPNGWLFLRQSSVWDQPVSRRPDAGSHVREWVHAFQKNQAWLAERGMDYLVVIAPDKQSIYPEELPRDMQYLTDAPLLNDLANQANQVNLPLLDLRPALREAKRDGQAYLKFDTHWNGIGSWYAARTLLERLQEKHPDISVLNRNEYQRASTTYRKPDLEGHVGIGGLEESFDAFHRIDGSQARATRGPDALMVHDSFGLGLAECAKSSFRKLNCIASSRLPGAIIERERPQIVIHEIVERTLKMRPSVILP